mmetsp:Transcript_58977/g.93826  ORF Transcript_58977/g.93826 Transcript_58977/m.93826 type:complete len:182 (+) Transcript_58977:45-590(+)
MGGVLSKLRHILFGTPAKPFRLLLLGIDSAGKTTILGQLKTGERQPTTPTVGFSVDTIKTDKFELSIWDVGGQENLRTLWRQYYAGTAGVIFVVDAADIPRLPIVKEELHSLQHEVELKYSVWAIVANKQDLPAAVNKEQLIEELELSKLKCKYQVFEVTATKGIGIEDVINWLSSNMEEI